MNIFDATIWAMLALTVVMGFNAGLLRSLAAILGYVIAAPVALGVAPALSLFLARQYDMPPAYNGVVLAGLLLVFGMIAAALLRRVVADLAGAHIGLTDRLLGALLGAVRVGFLAVLVVLIFDRIIPPGREPAFLKESQLRPYLSAAGQAGLRSLPPEIAAYIDRLKRSHGI